jgi:hypothetical protein
MRLVFSPDTHYGHLVEDTPEGAVYQDDRTLVDDNNPRPCKGCGAHITPGTHDPCIAALPGTSQACCGHGLELTPRGNLAGYAALNDGRSIRFSGCLRGKGVREAVLALQQGLLLPEGFELQEQRAWWEGLTEQQVQYVRQNIPRGLAALVTELKGGEKPSERFLRGEALWFEELDESQKQLGLSRMGAMLDELVQESRGQFPAGLIPSLPSGPDISPDLPDDEPVQSKPAGTTTVVTKANGKGTGKRKKRKPAPATGTVASSGSMPVTNGGGKDTAPSRLLADVPVSAGGL